MDENLPATKTVTGGYLATSGYRPNIGTNEWNGLEGVTDSKRATALL